MEPGSGTACAVARNVVHSFPSQVMSCAENRSPPPSFPNSKTSPITAELTLTAFRPLTPRDSSE